MTQIPYTKPDRYIKCPACNKGESKVTHLTSGTITSWYCDDCGVRYRLHVLPDRSVECQIMPGQHKAERLVTLRSAGPVTLQLRTFHLMPDNDETGHAEYFYNEHTCPTNYMRDVVKVIDENGDDDPHGVFQFVSIAPVNSLTEG